MTDIKPVEYYQDMLGDTLDVWHSDAVGVVRICYNELMREIQKKDEIINIMSGNMQDGFLDYMSSKERKAYMRYFYGDDDE